MTTMLSHQRLAEHQRACARVTLQDRKTAAWLAANHPDERLDNLDAKSVSAGVRAAPRDDAETPFSFAAKPFDINMGIDELESHHHETGDDATLAMVDHRRNQLCDRDRVARNAELTGRDPSTTRRKIAEGRKLLVNVVQVAANIETTPGNVFAVLDGLSPELQHAVAERAQREADLRTIGKMLGVNARKLKLSEGALRVLDIIGRNNPTVRETLAGLPKDELKERLADHIAAWRAERRRVRAREWRKERAFEKALNTQRCSNAKEIARLFRALPDTLKQSVLATIICETDEALQ